MTDREFQFAAKRFVDSETYKEARDRFKAHLVDRLLKAKTPEEREERWRDIDAFERMWTYLAVTGQQAEQ